MYGNRQLEAAGMAVGMDMERSATKVRESDTSRELEMLEKEIDGLNSALGYLKERIDPVCRPALPTPGNSTPGGVSPERAQAPLACHIQNLRRRLCAMREGICMVNDRIDI